MKKNLLLLGMLLCFALPNIIHAQTTRTLTGIVTTKGKPQKGVIVYEPHSPTVVDTTDEQGRYDLPVNIEVHHLIFKAADNSSHVVKFHHHRAKRYDFDTEQDVGYYVWQGNLACQFMNSFFSVYQSNGNNDNQSSLVINGGLNCNYHKNRFNWNTDLKVLFGQSRTAVPLKDPVTKEVEVKHLLAKNTDLLSFTSKVGYEMKHKVFITVLTNFQSQFTKSYADPYAEERGEELLKVSDFLSPANCNLGIGLDFKPNRDFSLYISPLDADFLIVKDTALRTNYEVFRASGVVPELGVFLNLDFKHTFFKHLQFSTKLQMFTNYIKNHKHPEAERPGAIDIQLWKSTLAYQFNKYIAISFAAVLKYDEDTEFRVREGDIKTGNITNHRGPRTQYFHNFGVSLGYNFSSKKS